MPVAPALIGTLPETEPLRLGVGFKEHRQTKPVWGRLEVEFHRQHSELRRPTDESTFREQIVTLRDTLYLAAHSREVSVMRLSELRRQVAKVRTIVRNPQELQRIHQVMEQIQRLEKEWEHIEALKKSPRRAG